MGKRILVIEDDAVGRKLLTDFLTSKGYEVDWATNGADGVQLAEERSPDLVVCDVLLPRMSGFEVCFALKRAARERQMPIVLVSALLQGESEAEYARVLKADASFVKPFELKAMLAKIEELLAA